MGNFLTLPIELQYVLSKYLNYDDIDKISLIYNISNEQWHQVCRKYFNSEYDDNKNYKQCCYYWFKLSEKLPKLTKHKKRDIYTCDDRRFKLDENELYEKKGTEYKTISISFYQQLQFYSELTDINKHAMKVYYQISKSEKKQLMKSQEVHTYQFCDIYRLELHIGYFDRFSKKYKVISILIYNLPKKTSYYLNTLCKIWPYQRGEQHCIPYVDKTDSGYFSPSLTTEQFCKKFKSNELIEMYKILSSHLNENTLLYA